MDCIANILILDDEESMLELYSEIFGKYLPVTFHLIPVTSGDDAYRILRDSNIHFDLLITDIRHPGKSCFELIYFIREKYPYTKVLIISAAGSMFSKEQLALADAYLPKPITLKSFIGVLKNLLNI